MRSKIESVWYRNKLNLLSSVLLPFSWLFGLVVMARRAGYRYHLLASHRIRVPVIVVGNVAVGGTGKTPCVIAIAGYLQSIGYHPGIISRGVGGKSKTKTLVVTETITARDAGDEAVLIARRSGCPMVVGKDRVEAASVLLEKFPQCNVIISDDGLQHYRMQRDVEIVVVDGNRLFGNGQLLPAGPLREPVSRLDDADFIIVNNGELRGASQMKLAAQEWVPLRQQDHTVLRQVKELHAVAGIGNPSRFFEYLRRQGYLVIEHAFPDHYAYQGCDFDFGDQLPIVMTEKDAVKCGGFADSRMWYVPVTAQLDANFFESLANKIGK